MRIITDCHGENIEDSASYYLKKGPEEEVNIASSKHAANHLRDSSSSFQSPDSKGLRSDEFISGNKHASEVLCDSKPEAKSLILDLEQQECKGLKITSGKQGLKTSPSRSSEVLYDSKPETDSLILDLVKRKYEGLKITSVKQALKKSPSRFQSLDSEGVRSDSLKPTPEVPQDLKPVADSLILLRLTSEEVKIASSKQVENILRESSSRFQSLDSKKAWIDSLISDLIPTSEVPNSIGPQADSLILDLVQRESEELKITSDNQALKSPLRFQPLDFEGVLSESLILDLKPTSEVSHELKPAAKSLILLRSTSEEEIKITSSKLANILADPSSRFQSLDSKGVWSDSFIPDLIPTSGIPCNIGPQKDSLILDLVQQGSEEEPKTNSTEKTVNTDGPITDVKPISEIPSDLEQRANSVILDLLQKGSEEESPNTQDPLRLKESPSIPQSLHYKGIWSDALIPDLKPTSEVPYDLKPKVDSLILDLVRRGIDVSLDRLKKERPHVVVTDFGSVETILFTRAGPNIATRNFSFCVHAPIAFQFFRELFGISTDCFRNSICKEPLCQLDVCSQSGTMYTTYDDRFLLKICQKKEAMFLESFFPGYFANVTENPKTLLPKFFGLYGYKEGSIHVHFLIMNNLVPIFVNLHQKYDLKGSTYSKRKSKKLQKMTPEEQDSEVGIGPRVTLKDLDFLERIPEGLYLRQKFYTLLMQSIERDCRILQAHKIMDYSLLLGIHVPGNIYWSSCDSASGLYKISKLEAARVRKIKNLIGPFEGRTSRGGRVHLYLGIIDILQSYTVRKECEHFFKLLRYRNNTMSVLPPQSYADRFKNFLTQSVFKCIPELISIQKKEKELVQKFLEDFSDDMDVWF